MTDSILKKFQLDHTYETVNQAVDRTCTVKWRHGNQMLIRIGLNELEDLVAVRQDMLGEWFTVEQGYYTLRFESRYLA